MIRIFRSLLLIGSLLFAMFPASYAVAAAPTSPASASSRIDINSATIDQLKALPGVGDAYSKRIVDGRPYANKAQLVSRGVLPAATYNKIKDLIIATQPKK